MLPADRADQLLPRSHRQRGLQIMTVGATVTGQPGEHEAKAVQKLRTCSKGAPDSRNPRSLVKSQRRWNIADLVHLSLGRLGHPPSRISRKGIQIPSRALRIQNAQRQGRFPRPGHPRNPHDLPQRDIHVDVFQVVDVGVPDLDCFRTCVF